MKEIELTHGGGKVALVDDEDYEYLNHWRWYLTKDGYAARSGVTNGRRFGCRMHRVILGLTDPLILTDHKDRDRLNNQKSNLRTCTNIQNKWNVTARGRSKYLGVMYQKRHFITTSGRIFDYEVIIARIRVNGKYIRIGQFDTEEDAALAYNKIAKQYRGEFANLNIIN